MDAYALWMAQLVDKICLATAFILPMLSVFRWNLWGVIPGVVVFWGALSIASPLILELDPARLDDDGIKLGSFFMAIGWLPGLVYCFLIYGLKRVALYVWCQCRRST